MRLRNSASESVNGSRGWLVSNCVLCTPYICELTWIYGSDMMLLSVEDTVGVDLC